MFRQELERRVDQAFDSSLNAHLRAIDAEESAEEWIESRSAEMRKAHGNLTAAEIGEALDSAGGAEVAALYSGPLKTQLELMDFALTTIKAIEDYWTGVFNEQARKEYYAECRF